MSYITVTSEIYSFELFGQKHYAKYSVCLLGLSATFSWPGHHTATPFLEYYYSCVWPRREVFFQFCSLAVIWPRRLNSLEPISMEKRLSPTTHNLASKLHKRSVFWLAPTIKCTWWLARSNAMGVVKSFKRSHYNQEVISFQNYYLQLKFTDSRSSKYTLGK